MPTIYVNGGSPNYTGAIFTNANELLALIKQGLEDAGWATITYDVGVNLFAKGTTLVNAHSCWVEFAISGGTLTIRGWLEEAKTNGSPNSIHTHTFTPEGTNRLWLTADEDSGCICIFSDSTGISAGTHFGFLQRIDPTDPWSWMIGRIRSDGHNFAYSAKAKHNNVNWRQLGLDYSLVTDFNTASQVIPITTFDLTCHGKPGGTGGGSYLNTSSANAFLRVQEGRRNYNNQAAISQYYYLEGIGASTGYSVNSRLYFRGLVKFAFCGVASEADVAQVLDSLTGNRVLSTGGTMWQGMRIL
ncbi:MULTISPECIES: hypothetical protein [unclassified Synechocystis]|uniref:hypothetical protein n=1 Tax=unclassified Synechocystis TaxID=2640012 RepID=UPI0004D1536F|nr:MULTISPECIES: hypothetical protein [unclassified Synechocystis]AIE73016.1 hypothetical protein D082_04870 [Synechocystis sp. PCC 6714]MCT0253536.1 hypothetical protein [Synechocystis sp. CS-94]